MEFILHYMYMVAIKDTKAWPGYSAAELSLVGFWNLIIVWLKVLLPLLHLYSRLNYGSFFCPGASSGFGHSRTGSTRLKTW
jgi:hypothetical protein